jgi:hypothetical protein
VSKQNPRSLAAHSIASTELLVTTLIREVPEVLCTMIGNEDTEMRPKNFGGRFSRPPFAFLNPTSSVSFSSLLPSFWLPLIYSPFPLFMDQQRCFVATD